MEEARGGMMVNISPQMLCWFVDNSSMNGPLDLDGTNYNKNDNSISPETVRATAEGFR